MEKSTAKKPAPTYGARRWCLHAPYASQLNASLHAGRARRLSAPGAVSAHRFTSLRPHILRCAALCLGRRRTGVSPACSLPPTMLCSQLVSRSLTLDTSYLVLYKLNLQSAQDCAQPVFCLLLGAERPTAPPAGLTQSPPCLPWSALSARNYFCACVLCDVCLTAMLAFMVCMQSSGWDEIFYVQPFKIQFGTCMLCDVCLSAELQLPEPEPSHRDRDRALPPSSNLM